MFDTENPVPRQEGRPKIHKSTIFKNIGMGLGGLGLGYAGLKVGRSTPRVLKAVEAWEKSAPSSIAARVLSKAKRVFHMQSRSRLIQFATGDYARKYLYNEPLLAKEGDVYWNPKTAAEVNAALSHTRPTSNIQKAIENYYKPKQGKELGERVEESVRAHYNLPRPSSIAAGVKRQQADIIEFPKQAGLHLPENLPKQRTKMPVRGGDYKGVELPRGLWDATQAKSPGVVLKDLKDLPTGKELVPSIQRKRFTPRQVHIRALAYRNPIATHEARVAAGLTENKIQINKGLENLPKSYTEKSRIRRWLGLPVGTPIETQKGLPNKILPSINIDIEEREHAQAVRDYLAGRLKRYRRDVLNPLRAERRKSVGLEPVKPKSRYWFKKNIYPARETAGDTPLAKGKPFEKPTITPTIQIGDLNVHPAVLNNINEQLGQVTAHHSALAAQIKQEVHNVAHANLSQKGMSGKKLKETIKSSIGKVFDLGHSEITPGELSVLTDYTGKPAEWIQAQHNQFKHHSFLGETQAGHDQFLREVIGQWKGPSNVLSEAPQAEAKATYPALKRLGKQAAIGAGIAGAAGLGAYLYNRHRKKSESHKFSAKNNDDDKFGRDVAVGAIEGGAGYLATDRLLQKYGPKNLGPAGKFGLAAGVGGLATGTIGYGLNRFLRDFKHKQKDKQFVSKMKEIRFEKKWNPPSTEGATSPYNPKKRLTVAQDRYKKLVRAQEIQRKEGNLVKSTLAVGALAGALHGKLGMGWKSAAALGGAVGLGTEAGLLMRGRQTRDQFGEESIASKRIERIPYQAAGLGLAGIAANKLLNRRKLFSASNNLIQLQEDEIPKKKISGWQDIPLPPEQTPWHEKEISGWLKHPKGRIKEAQKWYERAKKIHQDVKAPKNVEGQIIDEKGRTRTPEYKKPWVGKALVYGGALAAVGLAGLKGRKTWNTAKLASEAMARGMPASALTEVEKRALYWKSGNVKRALQSTFPKPTKMFKGFGDYFGQLRGELKTLNENVTAPGNRWIEHKVGGIEGGGVKTSFPGTPQEKVTGLKVINPAYASDRLKQIDAEKARVTARLDSQRQATIEGSGRGREIIENLINPKKKEKKLASKLRLIQFQQEQPRYEEYPVEVKPHYRRARRNQRPLEKPKNREAALIGTAAAGIPAATVLGIWLKKTQPARAAKEAVRHKALLAKRLEEYGGKAWALSKLSAQIDDRINFNARLQSRNSV